MIMNYPPSLQKNNSNSDRSAHLSSSPRTASCRSLDASEHGSPQPRGNPRWSGGDPAGLGWWDQGSPCCASRNGSSSNYVNL